jgi:hypothetical protein
MDESLPQIPGNQPIKKESPKKNPFFYILISVVVLIAIAVLVFMIIWIAKPSGEEGILNSSQNSTNSQINQNTPEKNNNSQPISDECSTNLDCDDRDVSTQDLCGGTNPKICANTRITTCKSGDNYCPRGCNNAVDEDCEPSNDPNECTTSLDCNDGDEWTMDQCYGTPKICKWIPFCNGGDDYCPEGCTHEWDSDCEEECDEEHEEKCISGKLYWYDSCGVKGDLKEDCAYDCPFQGTACSEFSGDFKLTQVIAIRDFSGDALEPCNDSLDSAALIYGADLDAQFFIVGPKIALYVDGVLVKEEDYLRETLSEDGFSPISCSSEGLEMLDDYVPACMDISEVVDFCGSEVKLVIDPDNEHAESNEDNNEIIINY